MEGFAHFVYRPHDRYTQLALQGTLGYDGEARAASVLAAARHVQLHDVLVRSYVDVTPTWPDQI